MELKELLKTIKKGWNWIWNSDSILSWVVALIVIFIGVKFIFFPSLSLIMGTSLPLAGVESSSMDHQIVSDDYGTLSLCKDTFTKDQKKHMNFDNYWIHCGDWYEARNITKDEFSKFSLKNGFQKGDIIIVWGRFTPKVGDIVIFKPNQGSSAPRPIIHRIVSIKDGIIETKGDHNREQLVAGNNNYKTDETQIKEDQIIGKAIIKIPYLGWLKIWITEIINSIIKRP